MLYLCAFEFFLILELQFDRIVRRQAHGIDDHHRAFQLLQRFVDLIAGDTLIGLRLFLRAICIDGHPPSRPSNHRTLEILSLAS